MAGRVLDLGNPVDTGHPLNRGRVAWWLGLPNNSGGSRQWDTTAGNKLTGTLTNGPTWVAGRGVYPSISYDGSNDYTTTAATAAILAQPFTVAVAFRQSTQPTFCQLFSHTDSGAAGGWRVQPNGSTLGITFRSIADYSLGVTLTTNHWHYAVISVTASAATAHVFSATKGYLTGTVSVGTTIGTPTLYRWGDNPSSGGGPFAGLIEQAGVWSRALSASECQMAGDDWLRGHPPGGQLRWISTRSYFAPAATSAARSWGLVIG